MPELPEVEHLRRSLDPWIVGALFESVALRRRGVVALRDASRRTMAAYERALLIGAEIAATRRHGKQLALVATDGRALVVQLGMTGSLAIERGAQPRGMLARHRHAIWQLSGGPLGPVRLSFRDPRRFGGLTAYATEAELDATWRRLGPDGLRIDAQSLWNALQRTSRAIKTALLDQSLVAGIGNIYADESLFAARIHPETPANQVSLAQSEELSSHLRAILNRAVHAGGSTLRDYRDAFGNPGAATQTHAVYGRAAEPCMRCRQPLVGQTLGGRTTVHCPACQLAPQR